MNSSWARRDLAGDGRRADIDQFSGRGMTLVGYVFGIISIVVLAIGLVFFAVWLAFVVAAVAAH